MGEDGARGKGWLRARGASPVSYRHNFLVLSNWHKKKKNLLFAGFFVGYHRVFSLKVYPFAICCRGTNAFL